MGKNDFVMAYADWLLATIKENDLMKEEIKSLARNNIGLITGCYKNGNLTINEAIKSLHDDIFTLEA